MKHQMTSMCIVSITFCLTSNHVWADNDPVEIIKANQVLLEVSRVYSELPVLMDTMITNFTQRGRPDDNSNIEVRISKNAVAATGIVRTLDVHALDGYLYLQLDGAAGAVKAETGSDPLACAKKVMRMSYPYLPPQIIMRWTEGIEGAGAWFTLGMLQDAVVAGYSMVTTHDGTKRHEIRFAGVAPLLDGSPGTCRVQIDSQTKLLMYIDIQAGAVNGGPSFKMTATFSPKTPERLDKPITLYLEENFVQHNDFNAMLNMSWGDATPTVAIGKPAPSFKLVDQNGKTHSSSAYRGKIIMLDWWGIWCSACRRDMPKVQELRDKYASNPNVVFLAMNVRDDNTSMAKFWVEKKYTFPTLNDADDLVAEYGVKAYPSAVLIGPDGLVIAATVGSATDLQEELEKAIKALE